jgi:hypothetical protein
MTSSSRSLPAAALITEIELLDEYPAAYDVYAKRQHRWARGDWQILRWLFPKRSRCQWKESSKHTSVDCTLEGVRQPETKSRRSVPISMDRPRRAFFFPGSPLGWSLFVLLTIAFPVYLHIAAGLMTHPARNSHGRVTSGASGATFARNTAQVALGLRCIATSGLSDVRCNRSHFISTVHLT